MADLEDVTLDGRPLQSLRVADLKAALEERGLSKSGQKNALIKRLKGALMLENLQRTSTAHIGLQPNSQIGEEMSQNSFIKQYLAKQQELLRQRLEREAREAYETNEQEDHSAVNNSTSCPPQPQDATGALAEQHKPPGPSGEEGLFDVGNDRDVNRNQEADMSGPPASGSAAVRVPGGKHQIERGSASSEVAADSNDDDSEDAEEDGDDDDWDSGAQRSLREPARVPTTRERSGASCQPQQQHIPSLLSPQLRQPTPPPSPPPELSFPLPDTPKQSPPSPDVAPVRRSPSTSSSGSSSSGSRSSSPEPQRSGHVERKPGPLTLLARKMESEGAFSGSGWHGGDGEGDRQDSSSPSAVSFSGRGPSEGLVSAISHIANTAGHVPFPMIPGTNQGVVGANLSHMQVSVNVLKATATEERDRERDSHIEREKALQLERQEKQQKLEQERDRALAREREERQRALEKERIERQQALEREEQEKALQRERELALEQERQERELALAKEKEEQEQALARERALEVERQKELEKQRALELERQKELERQMALEQENLQREKEEREKQEREAKERAMELERAKALEQARIERERALETERKEKERIEREKALVQERLEKERLEREMALEQERIARKKALEQERLERERALEQERIEREKALEWERMERERMDREKALEQERLERERALEQEKLEKEKVLEQERVERERALEKERLELERKEKERIEKERALEQERVERERALEQAKEEKEKLERAAKEQERMEKERAENERKEKQERERALEQEKAEREKALERQKKEEEERGFELERLEKKNAMQKQKEEQEKTQAHQKEKANMTEKERESHLPPSKRGREIGLTPLPTPSTPFTGPARKSSTEAREQDAVHAPMSQSEAQAAAPMSPQSSFKKFRFFRDSLIQPQSSSTPMVIKRPRTFSDTPQPQGSLLSIPTSSSELQQEGPQPSSEEKDQQMPPKQEMAVRPPGSVGTMSEKEAKDLLSENKKQLELAMTEHDAKESTKKAKEDDEVKGPASPVKDTLHRGRDVKKEKKQTRPRSSSNDSSSSESDSGSSSSRSSGSSTSSQEKTTSRGRKEGKLEDSSTQHSVTVETEILKKTSKASPCRKEISKEKSNTTAGSGSQTKKSSIDVPTREDTQRKRKHSEEEEGKDKKRQVKETAMAQSEKLPETSEEIPKVFSARKISLSSTKLSPGTGSTEGEQESGAAGGRKRRWGSSTAVTAKKPSISITTDSLKSLIPDIRPCLGQEAVVDLHPEEAVLSGAEDEDRERSDQDLQIRRTVTQVVHSDSQENGQKEEKKTSHEEVEEEDLQGEGETTKVHEEKMDTSFPGAVETQSLSNTSHDVEINTVTPSDTLIRRSISQQKTGVSITIDDPVRTAKQPSPPRGKVSNIVHICNLVRPFTLGQLKELLSRTGTLMEEGFWIDKIKSHCYVTYSSSEEAIATRAALHGVKWPQSNPKVLSVDFSQQDELDFHKGLGAADKPGAEEQAPGSGRGRSSGLPSLLPERDQWAEREREMERRERGRAEREWDRDKVREFGKPGEEKEGGPRRSRSRERRRKERGKSKEKKTEKKEKTAEDPPAKLLDDLFRKTKAAPCIYWLPLTEEQFVQRETARAERMKEREKRRKEQEEEEDKKREEERKEKIKAGGSTTGDRSEGEKDKERERERERDRGRDRDRERERENDKRRDGYRRPAGSGAGGGRRSRSRSDPRERRR
ncbi:Apoptotic chromatin condensation inducer in the nucleus [Channa argus]|uniref:Apoptotic chromatin condensation inducer in the nucleus n=1 Tax=Channa argus TaxID=215402 RepID=A0A6G1Q8T8_CHAAH|nr:Apoptotic chromatin condensation inducer in the nucleus [Channa argus]KAK2895682.1 hypothetical protein Q8A73_015170 [Channa argus]